MLVSWNRLFASGQSFLRKVFCVLSTEQGIQ